MIFGDYSILLLLLLNTALCLAILRYCRNFANGEVVLWRVAPIVSLPLTCMLALYFPSKELLRLLTCATAIYAGYLACILYRNWVEYQSLRQIVRMICPEWPKEKVDDTVKILGSKEFAKHPEESWYERNVSRPDIERH